MEKYRSGAKTPFKDANGTIIKVYDYVKDAEGTRYFVNTYLQAVPSDNSDATAVELAELLKKGPVTIMGVEEVLNMKKPVETRRRGGRRAKPANSIEDLKPGEKPGEKPGAAAPDAQEHAGLDPVTNEMILSYISDKTLADELRRRGYTLCAVKPALLTL